MEQTYVLWNAKLGGWLSGGGTYTSELDDAQHFSKHHAIAMAKRHYNREFGLIPVSLDAAEAARD